MGVLVLFFFSLRILYNAHSVLSVKAVMESRNEEWKIVVALRKMFKRWDIPSRHGTSCFAHECAVSGWDRCS